MTKLKHISSPLFLILAFGGLSGCVQNLDSRQYNGDSYGAEYIKHRAVELGVFYDNKLHIEFYSKSTPIIWRQSPVTYTAVVGSGAVGPKLGEDCMAAGIDIAMSDFSRHTGVVFLKNYNNNAIPNILITVQYTEPFVNFIKNIDKIDKESIFLYQSPIGLTNRYVKYISNTSNDIKYIGVEIDSESADKARKIGPHTQAGSGGLPAICSDFSKDVYLSLIGHFTPHNVSIKGVKSNDREKYQMAIQFLMEAVYFHDRMNKWHKSNESVSFQEWFNSIFKLHKN